jgi:molecular chaperone GrpE
MEEQNQQELVEEVSPDTLAEEADELTLAQQRIDELTQALQKERADFQNYRKRVERENESLRDNLRGDLLTRFLPIMDDFYRALEAVPEDAQKSDWLKGMSLIYKKFQSIMDAEGVKEINPVGEAFNPTYHEAIGVDDSSEDIPSDHITQVLEKGYIKGQRVLRTAKVRVAS